MAACYVLPVTYIASLFVRECHGNQTRQIERRISKACSYFSLSGDKCRPYTCSKPCNASISFNILFLRIHQPLILRKDDHVFINYWIFLPRSIFILVWIYFIVSFKNIHSCCLHLSSLLLLPVGLCVRLIDFPRSFQLLVQLSLGVKSSRRSTRRQEWCEWSKNDRRMLRRRI